MDVYCTTRSVGGTNRQRQTAAAAALLLGAGAVGLATLAGWPLYQVLAVVGASATVAWLVDGSSQRFMGPGLFALAVGGGITIYKAAGMDVSKGEHAVVYPLIGVALLLASLFNPLAMRGAGTFLLIVGAVATVSTSWNPGWTLTALLALWAVFEFARLTKGSTQDDPRHGTSRAGDRRSEPSVVDASR